MRHLFVTCVLFGMIVGHLDAAISVDEVRADWNNVVGAVPTFIDTDGLAGNEEIRWGEPVTFGGEQSGYRFDSAFPPPAIIPVSTDFSLGDFTHYNRPIFAPSITSAILSLTLDLTVDGNPVGQGPLTFDFGHNETPNTTGGPGDNDIVSLTNLVTEDFFFIGLDKYTLFLRGFSTDGGNTFTTEFSTTEGQANTAGLYGYFDLAPPPGVIPEPASIAVWGCLAAVVGFAAMKKKHMRAED